MIRMSGYDAGRRQRGRKHTAQKVVLGLMLFMTVLLSVSLYGVNRGMDIEEPEQVVGVLAEYIPQEVLGRPAGIEAENIDLSGEQVQLAQQDIEVPPQVQETQRQVPLVAIDAGHGGEDEGSSRGDVLESQVNLEIARRLAEKLQNMGFETVLVRESEDDFMTKEDRVKAAEDIGADIYVSIHQNAVDESQSSISGIETWYSQNSEDSRRLARLVQKYAVNATGANDRDVMETEELYVIREISMPACLIETGFLSNKEEREAVSSEEYQEKLAKGIAQGIDLYFHPKTMYLTFDDGPSEENTAKVLDILKDKGIKATFFLVGENVRKHPDMARRIVEEGHTVGVHCNRHVYTEVYASVDSYLEDFEEAYNAIYEVTGVEVELFRFPGGSINSYNKKVYKDIIKEMEERGFTYFDWNASLEDATKNTTPEKLIENAVSTTLGRKKVVMLAHDIQNDTVSCLEELLDCFPEYQMEPLTSDVTPIQF